MSKPQGSVVTVYDLSDCIKYMQEIKPDLDWQSFHDGLVCDEHDNGDYFSISTDPDDIEDSDYKEEYAAFIAEFNVTDDTLFHLFW